MERLSIEDFDRVFKTPPNNGENIDMIISEWTKFKSDPKTKNIAIEYENRHWRTIGSFWKVVFENEMSGVY